MCDAFICHHPYNIFSHTQTQQEHKKTHAKFCISPSNATRSFLMCQDMDGTFCTMVPAFEVNCFGLVSRDICDVT